MEFWACGLSRVCKGLEVDGRGLKSRDVENKKRNLGLMNLKNR